MEFTATYTRFDTVLKSVFIKLINMYRTRKDSNGEYIGSFSVFKNKKEFLKTEIPIFSFTYLITPETDNLEEEFCKSLEASGILSKVKITK